MQTSYAYLPSKPALMVPLPGHQRDPEKEITVPTQGHQPDPENGITVIDFNRLNDSLHGTLQMPRGLLQVLWISGGSGRLVVDGRMLQVENGIVYCILPGQLGLLNADDPLQGYLLTVSPALADKLELLSREMSGINQPDYSPFDVALKITGRLAFAEEILSRMMVLLDEDTGADNEILNGYLKIFMLYLKRRETQEQQTMVYSRDTELVQRFMVLVRAQYIKKKMVSEYASELFVTAAYLNRVVKKVSGYTASHHIQQCIISEAKRLCRTSRQSMKEIAYGLGFSDIAHFSKFFKNYTGCNFTSYKRDLTATNRLYYP